MSDLWRGMASRKSHVSELKNWMPMHSKKKKKNSLASGFSHGSFAVSFLDLFKVSKITTKFYDLFKVSKNTKVCLGMPIVQGNSLRKFIGEILRGNSIQWSHD